MNLLSYGKKCLLLPLVYVTSYKEVITEKKWFEAGRQVNLASMLLARHYSLQICSRSSHNRYARCMKVFFSPFRHGSYMHSFNTTLPYIEKRIHRLWFPHPPTFWQHFWFWCWLFFFFFWLVDRANGFKQPSGRRLREQNLQKRGLLELAFRTEKSRKGQECNESQWDGRW